ncbi:MAG: ABC transporter permease [Alphaproteobacteria bacterium]
MSAQPAHLIVGSVNWYGAWTLYHKEVRRFLKVPAQTLIAPTATTLLMLAIFALALGGRMRVVGDVPYLEFLAPGLVMMSIITNAFANTSSSLVMSKLQGNIVDLLMPPLTAAEIAGAFLLGGLTRGLVTGVVLALALQPFVTLVPQHPGFVLFHAVAASTALAMIGTIGGIWAERFDHISVVTHFVITPFAFLSGTFYSVERLPGALHTLTRFDPFFYMIDGFRYGFIGEADGSLAIGIAVMCVLNLALWLICHRLLESGYKLRP